MPPAHPREFRERAIDLARAGDRPIGQIAQSLGISESCLRNWVKRADVDDGVREGRPAPNTASWSSYAARRDGWNSKTRYYARPQRISRGRTSSQMCSRWSPGARARAMGYEASRVSRLSSRNSGA
ncbi:transposase [Nocardia yamanashiensis]|uniref:transposase n=1 Tax=Nocardia yamanashiensis TaxID=209247 RepID=UPI0012FE0D2F